MLNKIAAILLCWAHPNIGQTTHQIIEQLQKQHDSARDTYWKNVTFFAQEMISNKQNLKEQYIQFLQSPCTEKPFRDPLLNKQTIIFTENALKNAGINPQRIHLVYTPNPYASQVNYQEYGCQSQHRTDYLLQNFTFFPPKKITLIIHNNDFGAILHEIKHITQTDCFFKQQQHLLEALMNKSTNIINFCKELSADGAAALQYPKEQYNFFTCDKYKNDRKSYYIEDISVIAFPNDKIITHPDTATRCTLITDIMRALENEKKQQKRKYFLW